MSSTSGRNRARPQATRPAGRLPATALGGALTLAALCLLVAGSLAVRWGPQWHQSLLWVRTPAGIVIHHSASDTVVGGRTVGADVIDQWHASRGFAREAQGRVYHIGYHYVILADGTVQPGRPEWMPGAHTAGHNGMLGICLVGNFDQQRPSAAQLDACARLAGDLMRRHRLGAEQLHAHRDLGQTACPGRHVDVVAIGRRAGQLAGGPSAPER